MWSQFYLENAHFALNLFAALVMFAIAWLYFDAWLGKKTWKEGLRLLGFLLLSLSFVVRAITLETAILPSSFLGEGNGIWFFILPRSIGYFLIVLSLLIDPLQPKPQMAPAAKTSLDLATVGVALPIIPWGIALQPALAALIAFLYLRRATLGLEDHLKPVALGFFILAVSEILSLRWLWQQTSSPDLYGLVAPFGPLWISEQLILFLAILILGKWVFGYLLKRLQSQLFMIYTTSILIIFLLTTVTFTALLLKNLQNESLRQLETDVKVLNFAVEGKKAESLADAQMIAQNSQIQPMIEENSHEPLFNILQGTLLSKKESFLVVVDSHGQVLARGEDQEKKGDLLSDDPLVKRALLGETLSSVAVKEGVLAPQVSIRSAVPVKKDQEIIGAVMLGTDIDNAFVDGIQKATGLQTSIYGDNRLSATTLTTSDGKSRAVGIKEEEKQVKEKVLRDGQSFSGEIDLLNSPYFAAYLPLKDVDNVPVGMLFVGKPQVGVLRAAGRSIEMTFLVAVILLVLSVIPAFLISRYLSNQLR